MEKSNIDKLLELKKLYETGVLTKEEMEAEKAKILNAPTPKVESPNKEIPSVEDAESSFASNSDEESHGRLTWGQTLCEVSQCHFSDKPDARRQRRVR